MISMRRGESLVKKTVLKAKRGVWNNFSLELDQNVLSTKNHTFINKMMGSNKNTSSTVPSLWSGDKLLHTKRQKL